jgi:predicted TIM-barrel fold metal-dependent hydrolase
LNVGKSKYGWIKNRKRSEPEAEYETPVWLGDKSNGEFFHHQTVRERKMRDEILRRCDDNARKLGMDRREFIASSMGMLTTLSVFNMAAGCGDANGHHTMDGLENHMAGQGGGIVPPSVAGSGGVALPRAGSSSAGVMGAAGMNGSQVGNQTASAGSGGIGVDARGFAGAGGSAGAPGGFPAGGSGGAGGRVADGGFVVPNEACMNAELADRLLKQDYFIMDVQTHHADGPTIFTCINGDCSKVAYLKAVFGESETTVAVLSGLPGESAASGVMNGDVAGTFGVSNQTLWTTRDQVNMAAATTRMIAHCQVTPNATPAENSAMMEKVYKDHGTKGWKSYPPAEGGWFLTDPNALTFIEKARELKEPLICAHKGFPFPGWSLEHADPGPDVGKVALMFPDVNFVIYHSACAFEVEAEGMGPWNPGDPVDNLNGGTSRLAKVVHESGLTGKNVYAEMGSVWNLMMNDPMLSQHYVGKMLKYVGVNRLVWGTESIWLGAPQPQIAAFKMFKISDQIRDQYGYPDFTDTVKRQVFGLTSAGLYGINPGDCYTSFQTDAIARYRKEMDAEVGENRWVARRPLMTKYKDYLLHGKWRRASGAPDA